MDETRLAISGLVVLLAWIGWGSGVQWVVGTGRVRFSWGMQAALGMAVMLAVGGVLAIGGLVGIASLGAVTAGGVVVGIIRLWQEREEGRAAMRRAGMWGIGLGVLAALAYTISVQATMLNPGDDLEAYMVFPKQLLESGTLLAPFSIRRLGTYGGQQLLQAQWMAAVRWMWGARAEQLCLTHGHVVDAGICMVAAVGILWGAMRPRTEKRRMLATLVITAFLMAMVQRVNTHAQASGVVLFLALGELLPLMKGRGGSGVVAGVLVGLIAAGAASLRMNYAGAAVVAIAAGGAFAARSWRLRWPAMGSAAAMTVAVLAPWAVVLERSSHSPFYPVVLGNDHGAFLSTGMTAGARAAWAGMSLLYPPTWSLLFAWVPALLMRRRRDLLPLLAGGTVMTLVLGWSFTNQETINLYRLASPVLMACAWACVVVMMKRWGRSSGLFRWGTLGLLALLATGGAYPYSDSFRHSFSLTVLLVFAAVTWAIAAKARRARWPAGIAAAAVVIWTAFQDRARLAEGGVFFFDVAGVVVFAVIAWCTTALSGRIGAAAVAVIVGAIFVSGWIGIAGAVLVGIAFLWIAASAWVVWWAGRRHDRWAAWAIMGTLTGIAVLSMVNRNFLLESLAPWLCVACVGGAAWAALQGRGMLAKGAGIAAVVAAAFAGMPNIIAVYHFGFGLMGMGVCVLAAVVWMRMRVHPLMPAMALLAGVVLLGREEVPALLAGGGDRRYSESVLRTYAEAQDSTPPGSAIFTWVVTPALFDFGRNRVLVPDYDGQYASPAPGLPLHADAEALREYLLKQHIDYVAVDPERVRLRPSAVALGQDLMELSHSGAVLYRSPELVVFDLRRR
ncbi:MAG: hypothetical protein ACTHN5_12910 [Phycisphaerae bacterium]